MWDARLAPLEEEEEAEVPVDLYHCDLHHCDLHHRDLHGIPAKALLRLPLVQDPAPSFPAFSSSVGRAPSASSLSGRKGST